MLTLRIASDSCVKDVAGAIAGQLRESGSARLQAIGAGAVNQTVKAIALAGVFLKEDGRLVLSSVERCDVDVKGEQRTGLRWRVIAVQVGEGQP
jgi:stage V sporulation protein S